MTAMRWRALLFASVVLAVVGLAGLVRPDLAVWWKPGREARVEVPVDAVSPPEADTAAPGAPGQTVHAVELRRGDNLIAALTREGLDRRASHEIAQALRGGGADLRRLRSEHTLELTRGADGEPIRLRYEPSPWLGFEAEPGDAGWEVRRLETAPEIRVEAVRGEVARSLFEAVEQAGERAQLVLDLVGIFDSDFDFTADTRPGDRFRVLVEKRYAGDLFVDYGRILVAEYVSDGRPLTGVGWEPRGGRHAFYDLEGRSLRKTFLKAPLEFTRITSGFTYARPHPILGGTRPHLAIDYAAPIGTPVRAVADGVVTAAGWNGGNGISVRLRHRAGYETMYNHLSKLGPGIRAGVRVGQRQIIGAVGSTGLSTGPHLDYRVARHGRWVNPLSEKFLPGDPIAPAERAAFLAHARTLLERLDHEAPGS
jgi:murein DD-endopeptidase MepM/ murein hydrolase activator NlpD